MKDDTRQASAMDGGCCANPFVSEGADLTYGFLTASGNLPRAIGCPETQRASIRLVCATATPDCGRVCVNGGVAPAVLQGRSRRHGANPSAFAPRGRLCRTCPETWNSADGRWDGCLACACWR